MGNWTRIISNSAIRNRLTRILKSIFIPRISDSRYYWFIPGFFAGLILTAGYVVTHEYPAYGAGLYLTFASSIRDAGYFLPAYAPDYTSTGVPFAYPPLQFYVLAIIRHATGIDPLDLSLYLPSILYLIWLPILYYTAKEITNSFRAAGFAAILAVSSGLSFKWVISAGGVVRAPALILYTAGTLFAFWTYTNPTRDRTIIAGVLGAATVLSHPGYALYLVIAHVTFLLIYMRSLDTLKRAAIVCGISVVGSSPWWGIAVYRFGLQTILTASGTHGGIGVGTSSIVNLLMSYPYLPGILVWHVLFLIGFVYLVVRQKPLLPVWTGVTVLATSGRPAILIPAILTGAVVLNDCVEYIDEMVSPARTTEIMGVAAVTGLLVVSTVPAVAFATGGPAGATSESMPSYIDDDSIRAFQWVKTETESDASFVVIGDAGEWFPYITDRTSLVSFWGLEWTTESRRATHVDVRRELLQCKSADCVNSEIERINEEPDYLYIPRSTTGSLMGTVRISEELHRSLQNSRKYKQVYQNPGVVVYQHRQEDIGDV